MKKKYQIFISSTYTDLLEERQAAVQAVLRAGHIPAGMELFSAGDKSQLDTIKKWIQESDIYVLILGGRYGSLEPDSQISYTELEYRYAIEIGKPFFALVMDDEMLDKKNRSMGQAVLEMQNQVKYKDFKNFVLSKVCRFFNDITEIKLSILESIIDIQNQYTITGWIKGDEIQDNSQLLNLIEELRNEKEDLIKKVKDLEAVSHKQSKNKSIGDYSYEDVKGVLESKSVTFPASLNTTGKDMNISILKLLYIYRGQMSTGVSNIMSNEIQIFLTNKLVPLLLHFGLAERIKVKRGTNFETDKFILSALGNKFLSLYEIENLKK